MKVDDNMKKICLLTLNGYYNFGNRLQNYALEKTLCDMNCEVTTLRLQRSTFASKKNKIRKLMNIKLIGQKTLRLINKRIIKSKRLAFVKFSNLYLNESRLIVNTNQMFKDEIIKYDYIVVGSDQVWNPNNLHGTDFYFSPYKEKSQNIAYSPSFGIEVLPEEYKEKYKTWLSNFKNLSVREEAGQNIIRELIGIEVPVLVDPTLLLTKNEWLMISKPHKHKLKKNYLLTYFLGEEKKFNLNFIKNYADSNNLELVQLGDIKDKKHYISDPCNFIDYFNNASMIFTDSFHGSVFSIIFKKPFVVFKRGNMNSRIDTILSKFNLEKRQWDYVKKHKNFNDIDYSHVDEIINEERNKSFDYLRNALGIKKEE